MGGRCSLLILRSNGQRSSTLDIRVEIQFPGSRPLSLPPIFTITRIDYPWEEDAPYDLGSKVKHTGHQSRNMVLGL
jgi:hypothetical protein